MQAQRLLLLVLAGISAPSLAAALSNPPSGSGFRSFLHRPGQSLQPLWQRRNHGSHTILQKVQSPVVHMQNTDVLEESRKATDRHRRMGFIRKVYAIVLAQLLTVGAGAAWMVSNPQVMERLLSPALVIGSFVLAVSSYVALESSEKLRRTMPANGILLALFTLGFGFPASLMASLFPTSILFPVIAQTLIVTAAVTVFCFQPNAQRAVTALTGPIVLGTLIHLALFVAGQFIWNPPFLQHLMTTAALLLFSGYLMLDTAMVVGTVGSEGLLDKRDYVKGALHIFTDIINIFMQLLKLVVAVGSTTG